jgi:hypothetical protein
MTYDDFYDNPAYPYDWSENESEGYSGELLYEAYWIFKEITSEPLGHEDYSLDRKEFNSLLEIYKKDFNEFTVELAVREYSDYSDHSNPNCFEIE